MHILRSTIVGLVMLPMIACVIGADSNDVKQPTIRKATAEDAKNFFNGKDLTGWWGDMSVYHVENGEIVGKTTTGLERNEFLKSTISVGDFRLVCKIKLVPDEANSGIQFHSQPFQGHEMSRPSGRRRQGLVGKTLRRKLSQQGAGRRTNRARMSSRPTNGTPTRSSRLEPRCSPR